MDREAKIKHYTIIISGREHQVADETNSYEEIVSLRYDGSPPQGPNVKISVTYTKGPRANRSGTLYPGQTVEVKNEMIFDVTATDRS